MADIIHTVFKACPCIHIDVSSSSAMICGPLINSVAYFTRVSGSDSFRVFGLLSLKFIHHLLTAYFFMVLYTFLRKFNVSIYLILSVVEIVPIRNLNRKCLT